MNDQDFMSIAFSESANSFAEKAGAVLVIDDQIIAKSYDRTQELNDPTAIAEIDCIRKAGRRNDQSSMCLYTTKIPDMLGAGTVVQFGISSLVISGTPRDSATLDFLQQHGVLIRFLDTN